MRIQREIDKYDNKYPAFVSGVAIKWMKGMPYPVILKNQIKREEQRIIKKTEEYEKEKSTNPRSRRRRPKPLDVNKVIRESFDLIEDVIRFQYVQKGKAYIDILSLALTNNGHHDKIKDIFDFPLALELGISTKSGWSFMELGLSRIAASALQPHFPGTNLTVAQARTWLASVSLEPYNLSRIIIDELIKLKLIKQGA